MGGGAWSSNGCRRRGRMRPGRGGIARAGGAEGGAGVTSLPASRKRGTVTIGLLRRRLEQSLGAAGGGWSGAESPASSDGCRRRGRERRKLVDAETPGAREQPGSCGRRLAGQASTRLRAATGPAPRKRETERPWLVGRCRPRGGRSRESDVGMGRDVSGLGGERDERENFPGWSVATIREEGEIVRERRSGWGEMRAGSRERGTSGRIFRAAGERGT